MKPFAATAILLVALLLATTCTLTPASAASLRMLQQQQPTPHTPAADENVSVPRRLYGGGYDDEEVCVNPYCYR